MVKKISTKTVTYIALLLAVEVVLNRFFSFNVWNMKIGMSFIPVVLAAILFGPIAGGLVGTLGDAVGAILFPIGPYFPGFSIVAGLFGMLCGVILCHTYHFPRIVLAAATGQIICTLLLNTWNISFLYGAPYWPLLISRLPQAGLIFLFQLAVIPLLYKVETHLKRQLGTA